MEACRVSIIGCGLIGGSVSMGLKQQGHHVTVSDLDPEIANKVVQKGAADAVGFDKDAAIVVVATPVGHIAESVNFALENSSALVTDVGSTKAQLASQISSPRYVGGHPMAGSEFDGFEGATPQLFEQSVWVLTPDQTTSNEDLNLLMDLVGDLGAEAVTLDAETHDAIVAKVSHVPHLAAVAVMSIVDTTGDAEPFLRIAGRGFRDVTRVSAGRPATWLDICTSNSSKVIEGLDELIAELSEIRNAIAETDRDSLEAHLASARAKRLNVPASVRDRSELSELRVQISNESGSLAQVTHLAAKTSVDILDVVIDHAADGTYGIMTALVPTGQAEAFAQHLVSSGLKTTVRSVVEGKDV